MAGPSPWAQHDGGAGRRVVDGKTRACWEALHAAATAENPGEKLLTGWRLWHPYDPTRPDAALDALERVGPRTVVWLNETQLYLLTEGSDRGERVAAQLRTLLADPDRAPVLVLGTMWPEYWDTLTASATGPRAGPRDPHAQARELLAGTHIRGGGIVRTGRRRQAENLERRSPAREAARRAEDGELTQYLAGAPALLQRYETAPLGAKALLTAAMELRRLGHGLALPLDLLQAAVPAYLTNREWNTVRRHEDWFGSALAYAEQPCHGAHQPLTRIWSHPGQPSRTSCTTGWLTTSSRSDVSRRRRAIVHRDAACWLDAEPAARSGRQRALLLRHSCSADRSAGDRPPTRLARYCHAVPLRHVAGPGRRR